MRWGLQSTVTAAAAMIFAAAAAFAGCGGGVTDGPKVTAATLRAVAPNELRTPADFVGIADEKERSRALFLEASRVLRSGGSRPLPARRAITSYSTRGRSGASASASSRPTRRSCPCRRTPTSPCGPWPSSRA